MCNKHIKVLVLKSPSKQRCDDWVVGLIWDLKSSSIWFPWLLSILPHCKIYIVCTLECIISHDQDSCTNIITIAMTIACCEKFIRVDPHRLVRDPVQVPLTCY